MCYKNGHEDRKTLMKCYDLSKNNHYSKGSQQGIQDIDSRIEALFAFKGLYRRIFCKNMWHYNHWHSKKGTTTKAVWHHTHGSRRVHNSPSLAHGMGAFMSDDQSILVSLCVPMGLAFLVQLDLYEII